MVHRALIKSDKTVFLQKNCSRNGFMMSIVVHETHRQKYIRIVNKRYFIICPVLISTIIIRVIMTVFVIFQRHIWDPPPPPPPPPHPQKKHLKWTFS